MPTENERKFVLRNDKELERLLSQAPGVTRSLIVQAYLDTPGIRIRAIESDGEVVRVFTFKRPVDGQVVEIETELSAQDFARLWKLRQETLQKVRYSWPDGRFRWDVDFFKTQDGSTYFALAEVEMPEHVRNPPPVPPRLAGYVLGLAPEGDPKYTSKRLSSQAHAEHLMQAIRDSGVVS
jgi:CYTH domain-containing protein